VELVFVVAILVCDAWNRVVPSVNTVREPRRWRTEPTEQRRADSGCLSDLATRKAAKGVVRVRMRGQWTGRIATLPWCSTHCASRLFLGMLPQPSLERACVEVLCLLWFLILCMRGVQTTWSWVPRAVSTSGCLRCPSPTLATRTSSRPRPPRSKLPFDFLIMNWDTQRSVSRLWRKKETDRRQPRTSQYRESCDSLPPLKGWICEGLHHPTAVRLHVPRRLYSRGTS
jgi:hypothetical protein